MRITKIALRKIINDRTGGVAALIFAVVLSFTIFVGHILSYSLSVGSSNLKDRLGADIAVVPKGQEESYQGILLSGEPVEYSIERSLEDDIRAIEGVKEVTPVVYLASLAATCCSAPVQIIGYDPETDFVTTPWISERYTKSYSEGNLVIGSNIAVDDNNELSFFGRKYGVKAKLNKTGTGMDKSVYVTFDVMEQMIKDARDKGVEFGDSLSEDTGEKITAKYVSAFLVRVDPTANPEYVSALILRNIPAGVVQSRNVISSVTDGIGLISKVIAVIIIAAMILITIVTAVLHLFMANVRKKEWATFRMMGASDNWISALIVTETTLLSLIGAVVGIGLGALIIFSYSEYISLQIGLPYITPGSFDILKAIFLSLGFTAISGVVPGIIAGIAAGETECYELMREGEV